MSFYVKNGFLGEVEEYAYMPEDGGANIPSTSTAMPRRRLSYSEWEKMRKSKRKKDKRSLSCLSRTRSHISKSSKKHNRTESQKEKRRREKRDRRDKVNSNYFDSEAIIDDQRLSRKDVLSCTPNSKSRSSRIMSASPNRYQADTNRKTKTIKDIFRHKSQPVSRDSSKHIRKHTINAPNVTFFRVPRANSRFGLPRTQVQSPVMNPGTSRRQSRSSLLNSRPTKRDRFSMFWCFGGNQHKTERYESPDNIPTRDVEMPRRKSSLPRRKKSFRNLSQPPKYKLGKKYDYYTKDGIVYDPETDFVSEEMVLKSENLNLEERGSNIQLIYQQKQNDRPRKSDGLMPSPSSHDQYQSKLTNDLAFPDPCLREIASFELRTMQLSHDTNKCFSDNTLNGENIYDNSLENGFSLRKEENDRNVDLPNQSMRGSRNIFEYGQQTKDDINISENIEPVSSFLKKVIDQRRIYPDEYYRPRSIDLDDTEENLFPNNTNIHKNEISTRFFNSTDKKSFNSMLRIIDTHASNVKSDGNSNQRNINLLNSREHSIDEINRVETNQNTRKLNNIIFPNQLNDSNYKSKISNNGSNKRTNISNDNKYFPMFGANLTRSTGRNPNIFHANSSTCHVPEIYETNGLSSQKIENELVINVQDLSTGSNVYDLAVRNSLKRANLQHTGKQDAFSMESNHSVCTQAGGSLSHRNSSQPGLSRNIGNFSFYSNKTDRTAQVSNISNATHIGSYQNKGSDLDRSTLKESSSTMMINGEQDINSISCISGNDRSLRSNYPTEYSKTVFWNRMKRSSEEAGKSGISTHDKTSVFPNRNQNDEIYSYESESSRITVHPSPILISKVYKDRISTQESPIRQMNTRRHYEELNLPRMNHNSIVNIESIINHNESIKGKRLYKNNQAVPYKNEYSRRNLDRETVNSNAIGCFDDVGLRILDSPVDSNFSGYRQRLVFAVDPNGDEYVRTVHQPIVSNMLLHRESEYKQMVSPSLSFNRRPSPKSSTLERFGQHRFIDRSSELLPVKMLNDNAQTFELLSEQREKPNTPQSNRASVATNTSIIIGMAATRDTKEIKVKRNNSLPNTEFQEHIDSKSTQNLAKQKESNKKRDKLDKKSKTSIKKEKNLDKKQNNVDKKQNKLDTKQKDVDTKEKDVDTKEKYVDTRQNDIDTKQEEEDEKQKDLEHHHHDHHHHHHHDVMRKEAVVACKCGEKFHFTVAVESKDKKTCSKCYNKIRQEFTELLNDYKTKGFVPCGCKGDISVTDIVEGYMKEEHVVCTCTGHKVVDGKESTRSQKTETTCSPRPSREHSRKRGCNSNLSSRTCDSNRRDTSRKHSDRIPQNHGRKEHGRHHESGKCAQNRCGSKIASTLGQKMIYKVFNAMGGGEMSQDLKGTLTDGYVSCRCGDSKSFTFNKLPDNVVMCRCNSGKLRVNSDFVGVLNCCCGEKVEKTVVEKTPTPVQRRRSRKGEKMPACMSEEGQVHQKRVADNSNQGLSFRFKRSSVVAVSDSITQKSNRRFTIRSNKIRE